MSLSSPVQRLSGPSNSRSSSSGSIGLVNKHSQSTDPSRPTKAAPWQSPIRAESSIGSGIRNPRRRPTTVGRDERVGFTGTPTAAPIAMRAPMLFENGIDRRPSRLDCVFTSEQRAIPRHRVFEQPLIGSTPPQAARLSDSIRAECPRKSGQIA